MRIHRHDRGEVLDAHDPHRFGTAELLLQIHAGHFFYAAGINLRRPADAVQIDAAEVVARLQRLGAHAALADDGLDAVALNHVRLIRLFAYRGRWPRRDHTI